MILWEPKNLSKKQLLKESDLITNFFGKDTKIELLNIIWGPDSQEIILETKTQEPKKKIKYFLLNISEPKKSLLGLSFLEKAKQISFNPNNSKEIFWIEEMKEEDRNNLFKINLSAEQKPTLFLKNVLAYKIQNNSIYWLNNNGFLYHSDLSGDTQEILNSLPFKTEEESKYKLIIVDNNYFIKKDDSLYYLNNSSNFEKISDSIKDVIISPQNRKVALTNDYEITIFFLQDSIEQPQKKKGENVFITRFSKKINKLFWFNPDYLILSVGDEIKISEIDDRDHINIFQIKKFEGPPRILFDSRNKQIYSLINQRLYISQPLVNI